MRFGSIAKVLLKCKLKYYRISECTRCIPGLSGLPAKINARSLFQADPGFSMVPVLAQYTHMRYP